MILKTCYRFAICSFEHRCCQQTNNRIQCAIPVFDGLLPEPHNSAILRLLFICSHWHGLAKLRMHTDATLKILDDVTRDLGAECRRFTAKTCIAFNTRELKREAEARQRRQLKDGVASHSIKASSTPRSKKFNIQTSKFHSLGDYVDMIRTFGTSDSFSTEPVSRPILIASIVSYIDMDCSRGSSSTARQKLATGVQTKSFSLRS